MESGEVLEIPNKFDSKDSKYASFRPHVHWEDEVYDDKTYFPNGKKILDAMDCVVVMGISSKIPKRIVDKAARHSIPMIEINP